MTLQENGYVFKPHEQPFMDGSPASPDHPPKRRFAYLAIGLLLSLMAGLQNGFLMAALPELRGELGLDLQQGGWVQVSYYMAYACMSILFFKIRKQFGIQRFVRITMFALMLANIAQISHHGYEVELFSRAVAGISASGLLVLSMFYFMQAFTGSKKLVGLIFGLGIMQIGTPLAQGFVPTLFADGELNHVFAFQLALAMFCVVAVMLLPIPTGKTVKNAFTPLDAVSFCLFAGGIALFCAFFVQGRIVWWTDKWLAYLLIPAFLLVGVALSIESKRTKPMLDWHWMSLPQILIFAMMGAMARFLTSEQTVGAAGLMATFGLGSQQMSQFYYIMTLASLLGIMASIFLLNINDIRRPVTLALICFVVGGAMEIGVGMQTRPAQLYFSQSIVTFATLLFMGPMLLEGIIRAMAKSSDHIMSFSAVFGLSQSLGGLAGSAMFSAFLTYRTREHLMDIAQNLSLSDPTVVAAIQQTVHALSGQSLDSLILQEQSASRLVGSATREATVLAYSDLFALLTLLSLIAAAVSFAFRLYRRYHQIDLLAAEKAQLAYLLKKSN